MWERYIGVIKGFFEKNNQSSILWKNNQSSILWKNSQSSMEHKASPKSMTYSYTAYLKDKDWFYQTFSSRLGPGFVTSLSPPTKDVKNDTCLPCPSCGRHK